MEQNFRESPQQHFLIANYPIQSHINPARHLARKIVHYTGARVTVSTAISAHRKLCSSLSSPDEEFLDSQIYYVPYSDEYDEGFKKDVHDPKDYMTRARTVGSESLPAVLNRFKQDGQPVTHIIYSILMTELKRCLEAVMGDGESAEKVREMSAYWKERARVAVAERGVVGEELACVLGGYKTIKN